MDDEDERAWEDRLGSRLREAARMWGDEFAWTKHNAIEVIALIEEAGKRVIGVDTLIFDGSIVTPVIFDWDLDKAGRDPRFPPTPAEFVRQFSWDIIPQDESSEPYFSFTVD